MHRVCVEYASSYYVEASRPGLNQHPSTRILYYAHTVHILLGTRMGQTLGTYSRDGEGDNPLLRLYTSLKSLRSHMRSPWRSHTPARSRVLLGLARTWTATVGLSLRIMVAAM